MPAVNWDTFAALPGAATRNFETLCRALVRRHYGRFGDFREVASQPGVEFHLKLHTTCSLGEPGRWYGWQCRWYDLPSGKAIGSTRRAKIVKAIRTTEKELPGVADWVLWTRYPLTAGDQKWFYDLSTPMRLHLWTADDVESHLTGECEILRSTYFGGLALTPADLAGLHDKATAPIATRWLHEVHQPVEAERSVRRLLVGTPYQHDLKGLLDSMSAGLAMLDADQDTPGRSLTADATSIVELTGTVVDRVEGIRTVLRTGDLELLRDSLGDAPRVSQGHRAALRRLRSVRHPWALAATNLLADVRTATQLFAEIGSRIDDRLAAVLAAAGCGKTQLAAELTAESTDRPAGILLRGAELGAGQSLDDLARRVVIQGTPCPSFEALLTAVDSAGQRAGCRLPVVIDGLNESEDPRDWQDLLAPLDTTLRAYPYVLVVVTLRPDFAEESLPAQIVERVVIPDFGEDAMNAIKRYFAHYRIDPADLELPLGLLRHPLSLRLFCEVANPNRDRVVGVDTLPRTLTAVFDRYLEQAADRIAKLSPRAHRIFGQDVRSALDKIGAVLWEQKRRTIDVTELRSLLGDEARPWDQSIVRALEHEGVLMRVPGGGTSGSHVTVAFDLLAGNLIADALLTRHGRAGLQTWLEAPATTAALAGSPPDRHPLAGDILDALVGLLPRRLHREQLWRLVAEPLRTAALRASADLEGTYLDAETVEQLAALTAHAPPNVPEMLNRLRYTRAAPDHPLNAEFLDSVLCGMAVAERDLRWTEWVRRNRTGVLADLRKFEQRWRTNPSRSERDHLRARWIMWTLTSTVRELRDQATRSLYWYGRGDARALFALAIESLAVNDPYVSERLLAASYGVTMAHQLPDQKFGDALREYIPQLRKTLIGPRATHPTSHWLARLYVQGTVELAISIHPNSVPVDVTGKESLTFKSGPVVEAINEDDLRYAECGRVLHMDFKNYTLGRLCQDRRNYDMKHPVHREIVAHVLGVVWELGWRQSTHDPIDREIASHWPRDHGATERYGKKYGWIGFYNAAGQLDDQGRLDPNDYRLSDLQIDPSFPEPAVSTPLTFPTWTRATPASDLRWLRQGVVSVPDNFLRLPTVDNHQGPWIAVSGYLRTRNEATNREVFGVLTAMLVADADVDRLARKLDEVDHPGGYWLPDAPPDHYTFAGEIPWSTTFADRRENADRQYLYRREIRVEDSLSIPVEIVAHRYAWEGHHSTLNNAGGAFVPSRTYSAALDLRGVPQVFHQVQLDGRLAALSFAAPKGYQGNVLFLREDLLRTYADGRRLVWFIWGERQLYPIPQPAPGWYVRTHREYRNVWRQTVMSSEI